MFLKICNFKHNVSVSIMKFQRVKHKNLTFKFQTPTLNDLFKSWTSFFILKCWRLKHIYAKVQNIEILNFLLLISTLKYYISVSNKKISLSLNTRFQPVSTKYLLSTRLQIMSWQYLLFFKLFIFYYCDI